MSQLTAALTVQTGRVHGKHRLALGLCVAYTPTGATPSAANVTITVSSEGVAGADSG